ncbi:hypothetical protein ACVOMV_16000 [Mesorhizobium atlanticum]
MAGSGFGAAAIDAVVSGFTSTGPCGPTPLRILGNYAPRPRRGYDRIGRRRWHRRWDGWLCSALRCGIGGATHVDQVVGRWRACLIPDISARRGDHEKR